LIVWRGLRCVFDVIFATYKSMIMVSTRRVWVRNARAQVRHHTHLVQTARVKVMFVLFTCMVAVIFVTSGTVSWVLRSKLGAHRPLSPVIGLGLRKPKKERKV